MTDEHPDITALRKLKHRIPRARRRILDNIPGYPSGAGAAGGTGDRTTNLALKGGAHDDQRDKPSQVGAMHTDTALRDLQHLDRLKPSVLERAHTMGASITRQVSQLKRIIDRWDLSEAAADNIRATADDGGSPGCRSCARVGKWTDVHSNQMCHWCVRITPRVAALYEWDEDEPPVKLVAWHHDTGKNVKDSTIHSVMLGQRRRVDSVDAVS